MRNRGERSNILTLSGVEGPVSSPVYWCSPDYQHWVVDQVSTRRGVRFILGTLIDFDLRTKEKVFVYTSLCSGLEGHRCQHTNILIHRTLLFQLYVSLCLSSIILPLSLSSSFSLLSLVFSLSLLWSVQGRTSGDSSPVAPEDNDSTRFFCDWLVRIYQLISLTSHETTSINFIKEQIESWTAFHSRIIYQQLVYLVQSC